MVVRVRLQPLWKLFLTLTADLLVLLGVAGVLVWLWGVSDGVVYQYAQGEHFSSELTDDFVIARNSPLPESWFAPALPKRDPRLLGRLEIPSIHLAVMVREGVDAASLRKAAGHVPSSPLPGEAGNTVVLGHRDTFFRALRGIAQGDPIRVRTRSGSFDYFVDVIQVVAPEQSLAFQQDMPTKSITLITCFPFDYVGPAPRRFMVRARMAVTDLDPSMHGISAQNPPLERMQ